MDTDDLDIPMWVQRAWSAPFTKDDVLFRSISVGEGEGRAWETNAWVRGATDYAYAEGYRRAARLIADHVIRNRGDTDFLLYPIVFLYRHNVELQLKRLIPEGAFLADHNLSEADRNSLRSSHSLDKLRGIFEPILEKLGSAFGVTPDYIQAIDSYIRQIHNIDELSFSFRYAASKFGAPLIDKDKLPYFNLGILAAGTERLTGFLFGLGEAFHEAVQIKCEMQNEAHSDDASYRSEYYDGG
jgi:hypothetical protein